MLESVLSFTNVHHFSQSVFYYSLPQLQCVAQKFNTSEVVTFQRVSFMCIDRCYRACSPLLGNSFFHCLDRSAHMSSISLLHLQVPATSIGKNPVHMLYFLHLSQLRNDLLNKKYYRFLLLVSELVESLVNPLSFSTFKR